MSWPPHSLDPACNRPARTADRQQLNAPSSDLPLTGGSCSTPPPTGNSTAGWPVTWRATERTRRSPHRVRGSTTLQDGRTSRADDPPLTSNSAAYFETYQPALFLFVSSLPPDMTVEAVLSGRGRSGPVQKTRLPPATWTEDRHQSDESHTSTGGWLRAGVQAGDTVGRRSSHCAARVAPGYRPVRPALAEDRRWLPAAALNWRDDVANWKRTTALLDKADQGEPAGRPTYDIRFACLDHEQKIYRWMRRVRCPRPRVDQTELAGQRSPRSKRTRKAPDRTCLARRDRRTPAELPCWIMPSGNPEWPRVHSANAFTTPDSALPAPERAASRRPWRAADRFRRRALGARRPGRDARGK